MVLALSQSTEGCLGPCGSGYLTLAALPVVLGLLEKFACPGWGLHMMIQHTESFVTQDALLHCMFFQHLKAPVRRLACSMPHEYP